MSLAEVQDACAERLLANERFFDAVAILGPDAERVRFLGALLANISEPLNAALFGGFQEGKTHEVVLAHVTRPAFDCMMRFAAHLNPNLSADNVVPTLRAAEMYMINDLSDSCMTYIRHVKAESVVSVLSDFVISDFELPEDVERQLWCTVLLNSKKTLHTPSFVKAHGEIILRLLKCEEFDVPEEELWSRLVEWASNAAQQPALLGPLSEALPAVDSAAKRLKVEGEQTGSNQLAQQTAILQSLSKHVRFLAMGKAFFCDKVRQFLTRQDSDDILMFHLLGRDPPGRLKSARKSLRPPEQLQSIAIESEPESLEAAKLALGTAAWPDSWGWIGQSFILGVSVLQPTVVTKVALTFEGERRLWPWFDCFYKGVILTGATGAHIATKGRTKTLFLSPRVQTTGLDEIRILAEPTRWQEPPTEYARLMKVEVFGHKTSEDSAAAVVDTMAADLLLAHLRSKPDSVPD
eukprot:gnl/TRDRNA2_/TRDRNA2_172278_c0_seq1.p1 gnl/TRDRNA2_/TRDRNA2_172278_c0~~gnl/TRDRNA2_/TRDRNA2_172278_c0_seq1.p1  ORF type:complete len:465 (+),score=67.06 gnl/TRDRNA2_/TRDRNA2_172278_c0_seq1:44-1438(+)